MNKTLQHFLTKTILVCLFALGALTNNADATIRYVKPTSSGTADGSSWANASADFQATINASSSGDEVWVAAGTYQLAYYYTFNMKAGVAIFGGFTGTEILITQRNWAINVCTLQGNGNTVICNKNNGLTSTAILDGFTIIGGVGYEDGGATGDSYGGGMFNENSNPTISNCIFKNNVAYLEGGGVYNKNSSASFNNCAFSNNSAGSNGGGMYNTNSTPIIYNCTFSNNSAAIGGGGMYNVNSTPVVNHCIFLGNASATDNGGGIYNLASNSSIVNCKFHTNTSGVNGGGIHSNASTPKISNCIFINNSSMALGGAICNQFALPKLVNCTFINNNAIIGTFMANIFGSSPKVSNTIIYSNGNPSNSIYNDPGSSTIVTFSNIEGGFVGTGNISVDPQFSDAGSPDGVDNIWGTLDDGLRLLTTSPCINVGRNDSIPTDITTDIVGAPRIQNTTVDMGAYEVGVVVCSTTRSTTSASACGSYTWSMNNQTYTASTIDSVTLTGANYQGCDSIVRLNLTINPSTTTWQNNSLIDGATTILTACSNSPTNEDVAKAIDNNTATKFLCLGGTSNVEVTINFGSQKTATGFSFTTANDFPDRDPAGFKVEGSNDNSSFTLVSATMPLPCGLARFTNSGIFNFSNTTAYQYYKITFNTVCTPASAVGMQMSEVNLYGLGWSNGAPVSCTNAIINADYNTTTHGNINANSIVVNSGYTVNIESGTSVTGTTGITNNGNIINCGNAGTVTGIVTIHSVVGSTHNSQTATFCGGGSWSANGLYYNTSGDYTYSYTNAYGCASVDTLHLTVLPFFTTWQNGVSLMDANTTISAPGSSSPTGEDITKAIDNNLGTKFLSFSTSNIPVVLNFGSAKVANQFSYTTANDAPERDPAGFTVEGSNDGVNFTSLSSTVTLPCGLARNINAGLYSFTNTTAYQYYRITFTTVCNPGTANSIQMSEVMLYGLGWSNGTPTVGCTGAVIDADYNTSIFGNISSISIDVNNGKTLTVGSGTTIACTNFISNYGTIVNCGNLGTISGTLSGNAIVGATNIPTTLTAIGSYTWHGTTYTLNGDYTYSYTNAYGCASVDTLHLTFTPINSLFITRWNLATAGSGTNQLSFGVVTAGTVSYTWAEVGGSNATGSGTFNGTTLTITGLPTGATIDVSIAPTNFQRININNGADKSRLTDVKQWGTAAWTSMQNAFQDCNNLNITATDIPNLSAVTDMSNMFKGCIILNGPTNINSWNVSTITRMGDMFNRASAFNQNIASWNTASVTQMQNMFLYATSFNQNIGNWNVGSVTNMGQMFKNALSFDQNLGAWNLNASVSLATMLANCGMGCNNYSLTLIGWAANPNGPRWAAIGTQGLFYNSSAVAAHNLLTMQVSLGGKEWSFNGDVLSSTIWYLDADNDGYYVSTQNNCVSPGTGWTSTLPTGGNGDCDDADNTKYRTVTVYTDADNDGYTVGSGTSMCIGENAPSGYSLTQSITDDCNDGNASFHGGTFTPTTVAACGSYTWHGRTYTASTTDTFSYLNGGGCFSVDTLKLTIGAQPTKNETISVCGLSTYVFRGTTYTQSTTVNWLKTNPSGCDTAVTTRIIFGTNKKSSKTMYMTKLDRSLNRIPITYNGKTYPLAMSTKLVGGSTQVIPDTLKFSTYKGCDSTVLFYWYGITKYKSMVVNICTGQFFKGRKYSTAGTFRDTTIANCIPYKTGTLAGLVADSATITTINVYSKTTKYTTIYLNLYDSINKGYLPIIYNGKSYTKRGSKIDTFVTINGAGCNDTTYLNSYGLVKLSSVIKRVCKGTVLNGQVWNTNGQYIRVYHNATFRYLQANGNSWTYTPVDSVVTYNVRIITIGNSIKSLYQTSFSNSTYTTLLPVTFNGKLYNGNMPVKVVGGKNVAIPDTIKLVSTLGCDSTLLIYWYNLTKKKARTLTVCQNTVFEGVSYNNIGTFTQKVKYTYVPYTTGKAANLIVDSVMTYTIKVIAKPAINTVTGSLDTFITYISFRGCDSTVHYVVGSERKINTNGVMTNIYPNPAIDKCYIVGNGLIKLYDADGKFISEFYIDGKGELDISELKNGIYILKAGNKIRKLYIIKD